ncbi:CheR family methyltransferase [Edaphobacter albus]|uniref:CheR family methyltransferase n=1 Tax=Edaphobacter sp. 4G125 TaxID=2763071 RepID=UPI001646F2CB|nr:protein-glutamate O-methyltransferase CheR [Edaphobacter sp. 4G125]QNI38322.1 protein-glutamate O-methyltransferase CheR [Edaphobacter sp. 4G125]
MGCTDADYAYLRELVLEQSANLIDPSRNALFDTKLTPIAKSAGVASLRDFVNLLKNDQPPHLHRAVAEAMTINETSFFRDVKTFNLLRDILLPQLVERRREERRLRIWSAASSTGQEAYSLAILLAEHLPETTSWDVRIFGSDISRKVIEYARAGRYGRLEINRGLPARMLLKYFHRDKEEWEINPRLRAMCEFYPVNLCTPPPSLPTFDLVLLRNVLLYFSQEDRSHVFHTVYQRMADDGYLLLGNAEQAEGSTDLFETEFSSESFFYRPVVRT